MSKIDNKIISMYEDGHSTHEIAKNLKTYPNKIRRTLIKNGIRVRNSSEAQKVALEKGTSEHPTKGKTRTEEEKLKIIVGNFKNIEISFNDKIVNLGDYANKNQVSCIVLPDGDCSEFREPNN